MSEPTPEPTPDPTPTPEPPAQEPTTDWKAEARKWEARAKENKTALDDLTGRFTAVESEHGELAAKVQAFEAKEARAGLLAEVSKATGVPADLLRGETKEDLEAHAEVLKPLIKPSGPIIPGQERHPDKVPESEGRQTVKKLFGNN
ncbi:hypothetical protein [Arthrobacter sp. USHLN218]|uniref:hypothetical protein n=1 Tax=Arthrobacter sp. USHLN218 TaxID=3081232 RepID=UPI0030191418